MENNDYEYDTEDEEETQSENFFVNFYNNNKVLIWIFGGIITDDPSSLMNNFVTIFGMADGVY